jgi:hypothetical protein
MKAIFCLLVFFSSMSAHAEITFGIQQGFLWQSTSDGSGYVLRQPIGVRAGYGWEQKDIYLEYNRYSSSDGLPQLSTSLTHQEILLWGRYSFQTALPMLQLYVAAAPGIQWEVLDTTFMSSSYHDVGTDEFLFAAACGVRYLPWTQLELFLEGRLEASAGNQPNPEPDLVIGLTGRF